jgi:hypothetical protein
VSVLTTTSLVKGAPGAARFGGSVVVRVTVFSALGPLLGSVGAVDGAVRCETTVTNGRCSLPFGSGRRKIVRAEFQGSRALAGSVSSPVGREVAVPTAVRRVAVAPPPAVVGENVVVRFTGDVAQGRSIGWSG